MWRHCFGKPNGDTCVDKCLYIILLYITCYDLLFSAIERKKQYLYEMQVRPWTARKNNSIEAYLDLNHTVSGRCVGLCGYMHKRCDQRLCSSLFHDVT